MFYKCLKSFNILAITSISLIIAFFIYKISGRDVIADFTRPFFISTLTWASIYLFFKAKYIKLSFLTSLLLTFAYIVVTISYFYYKDLNSYLSQYDIIAFKQSNVDDILSFIKDHIINTKNILTIFLIFIGNLYITFLCYKKASIPRRMHHFKAILAILFLIPATYLCFTLRPVKFYTLISNHFENSIDSFKNMPNYTNKNEVSSIVSKDNNGELYIIVIGDSASRDAMGLYSNIVDNTPFLSSLKKEQSDNTVVFDNAYSSFVSTIPSITASFAKGNLYNGIQLPKEENLIDMANKAKFDTYWISNQTKDENVDVAIRTLSSFAKESYYATDDGNKYPHDFILLDKLRDLDNKLDIKKNNLIIIHILGSRSPYKNRYDKDYPVINALKSKYIGELAYSDLMLAILKDGSEVNSYLTAIKRTDDFLSEVYNIFSKRSDYHGMLYYSSFGEAVLYPSYREDKALPKHNFTKFTYDMTRIPFVVNVSDDYKYKYLKSFANMQKNQHKIVTNDTLYDFMLSFMQIRSDDIDTTLSVSSNSYRVNESNAKLFNGLYVKDDYEYIEKQNAKTLKNLILKDVQTIFMANSSASLGFNNMHINAFIQDDDIHIKAIKSDKDDDIYTLDEYIKSLYRQDINVFIEVDDTTKYKTLYNILLAKNYKNNLKAIVPFNKNKKVFYESFIYKIKSLDDFYIVNNDKIKSILLTYDIYEQIDKNNLSKFENIYVSLDDSIFADNKELASYIDNEDIVYLVKKKSAFN